MASGLRHMSTPTMYAITPPQWHSNAQHHMGYFMVENLMLPHSTFLACDATSTFPKRSGENLMHTQLMAYSAASHPDQKPTKSGYLQNINSSPHKT